MYLYLVAYCALLQMPVSAGEMRPSGLTAVASVSTSPAPPTARLPRCTRCQSLGRPSTLEYSHMGDTKMRFRNSTPRIVSGSNSGMEVLLVMSNCTNRAKWGRPMDAPGAPV